MLPDRATSCFPVFEDTEGVEVETYRRSTYFGMNHIRSECQHAGILHLTCLRSTDVSQ